MSSPMSIVSRIDSVIGVEEFAGKSQSTQQTITQCHLLALPLELRDLIYDYVFSSTRLTYGKKLVGGDGSWVALKPAPTSLALLYVCRQINHEVGRSWISKVHFSFRDTRTMLAKLGDEPAHTIAKIRHVELLGDYIQLSSAFSPGATRRTTAGPALPAILLPNLRLDTLTLSMYRKEGTGWENQGNEMKWVREIVKYGTGWKTVNLLVSGTLLASEPLDGMKPLMIHDLLKSRHDTVRTSTQVTVYRNNDYHRSSTAALMRWNDPFYKVAHLFPGLESELGAEDTEHTHSTGSVDETLFPKDSSAIMLIRISRQDAPSADDNRQVPSWVEEMQEWAVMRSWRDLQCFDIYSPFLAHLCMGVEVDDGVDGSRNRNVRMRGG